MKDLITTVAAITILMVFVMQFSANQVIMGRILAADKIGLPDLRNTGKPGIYR